MKLVSTCSALVLFSLFSCGGSGGSNEGTGRFIDAPVGGMTWTSGDLTGVTDTNGTFFFRPSTPVTFSMGNIILGTVQGSSVVTPIDLVPGAVDETNTTVINILRFMQSIDADGIPANGIDASNTAGAPTNIDFTQSTTAFAADTTLTALLASLPGTPSLVSISQAQTHFQSGLLQELAGRYRGTFSGDDSGTWEVAVDIFGQLVGTSINVTPEQASVIGSVSSDGTGVFGNSMLGSTFTGNVVGQNLSGTWSDSVESGTFTGSRVRAGASVLDPAHLAPIVGSYPIGLMVNGGGLTPAAALTVDASGLISITVSGIGVSTATYFTALDANGGSFAAVDENGLLFTGSISNLGVISGSFFSSFFGVSGTIANI